MKREKISFDIDEDQFDGIGELAQRLGVAPSQVCRLAVAEYLASSGIVLKRRRSPSDPRQSIIPGID